MMSANASTPSVAARIGVDHFPTFITMGGRHTLTADEPRDVGGADNGPNPYELLLASLAACKLITLRMYADRKGWPLTEARIELTQERVHAEDCEDCESKDAFVHVIQTTLHLDGDLTPEQRARIFEIADKCPVHRTLTGEIKIRSKLADIA